MGKTPRPPDPYKTAEAQRQENTWTSQFNTIGQNANQYTPYGSVTNSPGAKIPIYDGNGNITGYGTQWNQNTTLSPAEQRIFDIEQANRQGLGSFAGKQIGVLDKTLGKPFNTEGLPDWAMYGAGPALRKDSSPTDRAAIEDAIMASTRRGMEPKWNAEDAQMTARGMGAPGSEYGYATDQARGDVMAEAGRGAYLASGDESRKGQEAYNKVSQQDWQNANLRADQRNSVRTNMFGERQQERNQIVNEIAALMGGSPVQVPQGQAFQGSSVNPFDWNAAFQNQYAQQQANAQNNMSGLFGIGSSILGMLPFGSMFKGLSGIGR